jgi:hypothetical protein
MRSGYARQRPDGGPGGQPVPVCFGAVLDQVLATRYVAPLREGGSLPGLVEAADLGTYVMKFRGAGQGAKVLVAEVIVGELARRLGFKVPDLKVLELDPANARYEADEEVQDLLTASLGLNLGVDFLPGALGYDGASVPVDATEATALLWLDGLVANVDRSWQNPNLLVWHRQLWLIDHGAALYFHHNWHPDGDTGPARFAAQPYAFDRHIMASHVAGLLDADARLAPLVTHELLADVVAQVPADWLDAPGARARYIDFLLARARSPRRWLPEER